MKGPTRLNRAAKRYRAAQSALETARDELLEAMLQARSEGMTLDAIGGVLGVSRQRVMRMLEDRASRS